MIITTHVNTISCEFVPLTPVSSYATLHTLYDIEIDIEPSRRLTADLKKMLKFSHKANIRAQ